jgi:hypothetical protein
MGEAEALYNVSRVNKADEVQQQPTWGSKASRLPIAPLNRAQAAAHTRSLGQRKRPHFCTNTWRRKTSATTGTTAAAVNTVLLRTSTKQRCASLTNLNKAARTFGVSRGRSPASHGRVREDHVVKAAVSMCVRGRPLVTNALTMAAESKLTRQWAGGWSTCSSARIGKGHTRTSRGTPTTLTVRQLANELSTLKARMRTTKTKPSDVFARSQRPQSLGIHMVARRLSHRRDGHGLVKHTWNRESSPPKVAGVMCRHKDNERGMYVTQKRTSVQPKAQKVEKQ